MPVLGRIWAESVLEEMSVLEEEGNQEPACTPWHMLHLSRMGPSTHPAQICKDWSSCNVAGSMCHRVPGRGGHSHVSQGTWERGTQPRVALGSWLPNAIWARLYPQASTSHCDVLLYPDWFSVWFGLALGASVDGSRATRILSPRPSDDSSRGDHVLVPSPPHLCIAHPGCWKHTFHEPQSRKHNPMQCKRFQTTR